MIQAEAFVQQTSELGFTTWAGVPCSFIKPFINYVIDHSSLSYISSANEGDAVATASGVALSGQRAVVMMQNSGLGNAVSPLSSLNWVFRIPVLLIVTWRGEPGVKDEPQHELMGQITQQTLELLDIPWRYFPQEEDEIAEVLSQATDYMDQTGRPFALVMHKGSVAPYSLKSTEAPGGTADIHLSRSESQVQDMPSRTQALQEIMHHSGDDKTVVLATTGFTGRELYALQDRNNQLYMVGSMGCASSLGLGLALARPDLRVVVVDGDGAALMRMGNLATIGAYGRDNLHHILLDNGVHDSTGGQATVSRGVDFASVASACGYHHSHEAAGLQDIPAQLSKQGPSFLHLRTSPGAPADLPRPSVTPIQVRARLMEYMGASASWLNAGLEQE